MRLRFELAFNDFTIKYFSHGATGIIPRSKKQKTKQKKKTEADNTKERKKEKIKKKGKKNYETERRIDSVEV